MRWTCVSTTTPEAMPKAVPRTTLAVLRAAPGTVRSASMSRGTWPPKSEKILRAAPEMDLALLLKKPVERMSWASSAWFAAAKSWTVGYLRKSPGVTMLTRRSVHCAERIVATSNSQGPL